MKEKIAFRILSVAMIVFAVLMVFAAKVLISNTTAKISIALMTGLSLKLLGIIILLCAGVVFTVCIALAFILMALLILKAAE